MFASHHPRHDFADTRTLDTHPLSPFGRFDSTDPLEQLALTDAADRTLLRLVLCAAAATGVLALASSLGV